MTGNNMSSGVYTGFLNGSAGKESACKADDTGDAALIPGWERFPRGGHSNPFQYSCLENPKDREAWRTTVHGAAKSWIRLKQPSTYASSHS